MRIDQRSSDFPGHLGRAQAESNNKQLRKLHRQQESKITCIVCSADLTQSDDTFIADDGVEYCDGACYIKNLKKYF